MGVLAFHVFASILYGFACLGIVAPVERDTRGIAIAGELDERWAGIVLLVPGVLDAYRYFHPSLT